MKNVKKLSSLLCALLMTAVFTFAGLGTASAATKTVTISKDGSGAMKSYIGTAADEYQWARLKTSDGKVAFCMDIEKEWPVTDSSYTLDKEASAGIKYILLNGYPNKKVHSGTTHDIDRFITQAAIWWYLADTGEGSVSELLTTTGIEAAPGIRDAIKALVEGAKSATATNDNYVAYVFKPSDSSKQRVVALYEKEATPEKVCVDYVIVGDVIPDPSLTDPTPEKTCYDKGTKYTQENGLTTRQNGCKFNGWYTKRDLSGKWTDGTALNNDMTLYGAWTCPAGTEVKVPSTAANTSLVILGTGLVIIAAGVGVYLYRDKKINAKK